MVLSIAGVTVWGHGQGGKVDVVLGSPRSQVKGAGRPQWQAAETRILDQARKGVCVCSQRQADARAAQHPALRLLCSRAGGTDPQEKEGVWVFPTRSVR